MSGGISLSFSTQAQLDLQRMSTQLNTLQQQVSSGDKANDLQGFGGNARQLLDAQSLQASTEAQVSAINLVSTRFDVQSSALSQISSGITSLSTAITNAISSNDGSAISSALSLTFSNVVSGLNEQWNGQPLFAGDRASGQGPVIISSLDQLVSATTPSQLFSESDRPQSFQLGSGPPTQLADLASTMATPLFNTLRQITVLMNSAPGGAFGSPLTSDQTTQLQTLVGQLKQEADTFSSEQANTGQLQSEFASESTSLQSRSTLLASEISNQADADLASVSVQLNALETQYQASAKTFSDLSQLSLLNYLPNS